MKKNALNARVGWFFCQHEELSSGGARSAASDFHTVENRKEVAGYETAARLLQHSSGCWFIQ